jgi:hypothetical protein
MRTPTIALTAMINAAIRSDHENVAFQGDPSERTFTRINATPIDASAPHVLSRATTPIAVRIAQIHRVNGCSVFFIVANLLFTSSSIALPVYRSQRHTLDADIH